MGISVQLWKCHSAQVIHNEYSSTGEVFRAENHLLSDPERAAARAASRIMVYSTVIGESQLPVVCLETWRMIEWN